MREWIPVPGSTRGDLVLAAVREFAARGYAGVGVGELARAAGVTTGSLYHHFGSKQGLYGVVRDDVERRVLDRMEGAAEARAHEGSAAALRAALLVGFEWATAQGMARLLAEPHPGRSADPLADFLARIAETPETPETPETAETTKTAETMGTRETAEPPETPEARATAETAESAAGAAAAALAVVLLAAWRAALQATADGLPVAAARRALGALRLDGAAPRAAPG